MDSAFKILWTTRTQGSGRVSVYLHSDSGDFTLAENMPDTGSLLAYIGERRLPNLDAFRVKVEDAGNPERMDFGFLFDIFPFHDFRVYFRAPSAGAILQLDSQYAFGLDLPPGPPHQFEIQLLRNDTLVTFLPSSLFGSDLKINLSGQGVGSGDGFRIRLTGYPGTDFHESLYGKSATFSIASRFHGGAVFVEPGPHDTLIAGSVDTAAFVNQGNPGVTKVSGIYSDSAFIGPVSILNRFESGDTQMVVFAVPKGVATGSRYRIGIASESDPNLPISLSDRFAIAGIEPDIFEYDNMATSAKELRLGDVAQRHTLPDGDTDWVWFDAQSENSYAIQIRGLGNFVPPEMRDASVIPLSSLVTYTPPDKSTFALRPQKSGRCRVSIVSGWSTQRDSLYSYSISLAPVNQDSTGLLLGFMAPVSGARIAAGGEYTVRWNPDTLFFDSSVRLELYRDSTRLQVLSEAAPNSGVFGWNIDPWMATSSRYRIRISKPGDTGISGYSPTFAVEGKTPDLYEPDGDRSLAKRIEPGAPAQSRNLMAFDTDWVAFNCVNGTRYRVEVESDFPLILNVFSGLQTTVGGVSPSISEVEGAGSCAIQVEPYRSNHGQYTLSVRGP